MNTNERIASALERIADVLEAALASPGAQALTSTPAHMPTFAGFTASWTKDAAGFPSYIIDADGEIADKHEKQGDTWYSVKDESAPGGYRRLLTIKAGETLPEQAQWTAPSKAVRPPHPEKTTANDASPAGSHAPAPKNRPSSTPNDTQAAHIDAAKAAAASPQAEAPKDDNPFTTLDAGTLRQLHALGQRVHGPEGWRQKGPERIIVHSDGRAERSDQLSHSEAMRLIAELRGQLEKKKAPDYAG